MKFTSQNKQLTFDLFRRTNRDILEDLEVRSYCKPLGRPPKDPPSPDVKARMAKAVGERNEIECSFGTGKTRNANGIITSKPKYLIPTITIGGTIVHNLEVIFDSNENGSRLVDLNYLKLFKSVTLDISHSTLILVK